MLASPKALWDNSLLLIKDSVTEQQYNTWFKPIVFESYKPSTKTLLVQVPSPFVYEYLEQNFVDLLSKVLHRNFGEGIRLTYRVVTDKEHKLSQDIEADPDDADMAKQTRERAQQTAAQPVAPQQQEDIDTQLDPKLTFNNYMEGDSNKLPRSVGLSIAEHPNTTQFNPMFIYGPSGSGKTHLVNAIGLKAKQMYPQKRVLYVSARLFQTQYTDAVLHNASNDFINFYQSIDMLIVDDIQEWAGKAKTLNTFFHIFNHLFRNGKRIILASDRPPVELKDMPDRLLTRFSCGLVCELEKPNIQLCVDILSNKIRRDGLKIPVDVISFIAQTCNGSVRDLQGAINGLLAYSIVYNSSIDIRLAERVIKRAVKVDDKPLTIDDIVETVCHHYNVTVTAVNSKSRKRDYVVARQVTMYLAQKYTKMPASRIGKLVGNRDHSTVIHSCSKVEERLKIDAGFSDELVSIENGLKVKRA
ncbi:MULTISPECIES: chromosomal replication initiator protein DnaA [Segatella]|jgi:chromosomal replication initiator protein|uniref:Chromosomal replication initiator protein DnaA n=1 Tax=Segatella copri TaxID=165179 RepID=A0A3E5E554_9BACT|nr:chromosomal replication initiator protein DnaA [Segatella copri]MEE1460208.1 chromosomal replication initiator protein DnaA [Segatella copri]RGN83837.1 chromosomal replication initiator protein DnaA [Segatella copri]RGS16578.1 chromosomal replication initiator protein DnaA [Segatella copri]RHG31600.1 chromosomal replication initiator protein DnaA [Segatella copri]RHG36307.1 chromosomal replication initiator protein DnaA [Segatella copri]